MARMIATKKPSIPAECWVFEALKRGYRTSGWTVYYAYYVTDPKAKKTREIDFVVTIPDPYYCVICLEVKGGVFGINKTEMWYASGGAPLKESPHDKVTEDMYTLKDNFRDLNCFYERNQQGLSSDDRGQLSLGCAVAFRDMDEPTPRLQAHLAKSIWAPDVRDQKELVEKLKDIAKEIAPIYQKSDTKEKGRRGFSKSETRIGDEGNANTKK